jgi:hypothetical protein
MKKKTLMTIVTYWIRLCFLTFLFSIFYFIFLRQVLVNNLKYKYSLNLQRKYFYLYIISHNNAFFSKKKTQKPINKTM